MTRVSGRAAVLVACAGLAGLAGTTLLLARAATAAETWSVTLLTGVYRPSLTTLNDVIATPRLAILQDPNHLLPGNPRFPSTSRNLALPGLNGKQYYGLEALRAMNPRLSVVATLSVWQGESTASDIMPLLLLPALPLEPSFRFVPRETRYNLTLNQLWLGVRYKFLEDPDRARLFLNLQVFGVAFSSFTIDTLLKVVAPEINFASVSSTEAQGFGYTSRFGLGGEYYVHKWLSFGLQGNYVIGAVPQLTVVRHFPIGFPTPQPSEANVLLQPPPKVNDVLTFAPVFTETPVLEVVGPEAPLRLELDGYEVVGALRLHF